VGLLSLLLFASLAGALFGAGSLLDSVFDSLGVAVSAAVGFSAFTAESSLFTVALPDFRLSVIYQPEPLKTMPTG
jgi:hypothetical protein